MKLKIEIKMDNAAFEGSQVGTEAARILKSLSEKLENEGVDVGEIWPMVDYNGNRVGEARVTR